jgi:threonyl-tRNA synthetase
LEKELSKLDIRVELDLRSEKIGYKIREAQLQKIPYMIILGDKEVESGNITVRDRKSGDLGAMNLKDFTTKVMDEVDKKISSI